MKENKTWVRGINVTVSPEAHRVLTEKANEYRPKKKTLRALINLQNNLPEDS